MDSEGFVVEWIGEEFGLGVRVVFVVLVVTTDYRSAKKRWSRPANSVGSDRRVLDSAL